MADYGRTRRDSGDRGIGRGKAQGAERASLYDEVTAKIIAQLEAGCLQDQRSRNEAVPSRRSIG